MSKNPNKEIGLTNDPWTYVRGLQPVSFCDWPEKVSCVLFLGTCNLRCPTCHNHQLAWEPESLPLVPKNQIFSFLKSRQDWLDGIVISGGEPTQVPNIKDFLKELRAEFAYPIKIDTNGMKPDLVKDMLIEELVDLLAVDVKAPWPKYPEVCGNCCTEKEAKQALTTIFQLAVDYPKHFYFRLTKLPCLSQEDIQEVKTYLPDTFELKLQDYIKPSKD